MNTLICNHYCFFRTVLLIGHLLWNIFENRKIEMFSDRKTRHTEVGRPYHDTSFSDSFGQQVLTTRNSGRMVAPCGTRKRFREIFASSLDYMGLVAPEHLSPCRSSMVLAKRETQHIRFTLGGLSLGVIFSSRWLCRSRSSTASYLPDGDYPPRPRRGKHCLWLRNIAAALIVDTITTTTSQRFVVMPEACRGG